MPWPTRGTVLILDHYNNSIGPLPHDHIEVRSYQFGSLLVPRRFLQENNDALQVALRNVIEHGALAVSITPNVSRYADCLHAVIPA
jgi:hypothetical protein